MQQFSLCFGKVKKDCLKFIKSQETKADKFKNKEKMIKSFLVPLCFWINKKIQTLNSMPSFYSISGTKSLKDLLPIKTQRSNEIGISEHINLSDGKLKKEFIDHIISNGKAKKQYNLNNTPITLLENTLFSNEIDFPTNLYEGNYKVKIHLIRFEEVLATKQDIIYVKKIGVQNWINYLAYQEPKLYGIACIIIAISFGFGASLVFRKKV